MPGKPMSLILTFEGLDGCGKSTQCRLLHGWLKSQDVKANIFRFPGFSPIGKRLRRMASSKLPPMSPLGAALGHFSDMAEFSEFLTNSSSSSYSVYLCDRFFDSTIAYQGATSAPHKDQIIKIRDIVFSRCKPNKTFFLDAEPEILLPRLQCYPLVRASFNPFRFRPAMEPSSAVYLALK